MTRDQYAMVVQLQVDVSQLAILLETVARGFSARETDAVEACATLADSISHRFDSIPGFVEAASRPEGSEA